MHMRQVPEYRALAYIASHRVMYRSLFEPQHVMSNNVVLTQMSLCSLLLQMMFGQYSDLYLI